MALSKINTRALANDSVTVDKVADNAVTTAMITDGTIGVTDLADGAITNAKVSSTAAISASKINFSTFSHTDTDNSKGWRIATDSYGNDGSGGRAYIVLDSDSTDGIGAGSDYTYIGSNASTFRGDVDIGSAGLAGGLKVGGNTVIDSSRNLVNVVTYTSTAPNGYYTHIGSGNTTPGGDEPLFGIFNNSTYSSANFSWGIYDSNSDGSLQIWNRNNSTTGYEHLTLKRGGNVNIATGDLQVGGTTAISASRVGNFAPATTIGSGATTPTDGGTLQLTRSNNNPYIGFYSNDGTRNGFIQTIGSGPMYIANEEGGGWHFNNGANVMSVTDGGSISIGGGTNQAWAQLAIRKANDAAGIALESDATNGLTYEVQSGPNGNFLFYDRSNSRYLYSGYNYQQDWYVSSAVAMRLNSDGLQVSTGGLGITSGTKTYRNEINNSSTAFLATGTLYINTALNGSGEGVLISSETRTTNDNDVSMFRLVDRAGATAFQVDVDGTGRFENTFYAGNDSTVAGDLRIFDTGNNQLQMAGVGSNSFRFDMVGTSSTGVLEVKDLVLSVNADLGNSGNSLIIGVNDETTKKILFDEAPGSYSLGSYGGEVGYDGYNNFTFIGRNTNSVNSKVLRVARDNDAVTIGGTESSSWNNHNYSLRTNNGIDINNQTGLYFQSGDAAIEEIGSGSYYGLKFTAYNAGDTARRTKLTIEDSKDAPAVGYYRGQQTWYQGQGPWALRGAKWNRVAYIDHRRAYEIIVGTHGGWFGPGHICMHMSIGYTGAAFGLTTLSSYSNYVTQVRFTCNGNGSGGGYLDIYVTSSYDQNGPSFHIRPLDGGTYDFVDTQTLDPSTLTYTQTTNT